MGNSVSEREKKEADFGDRIYEIVCEFYPESSANVTGMLLEADYNDLERLLGATGREDLVARIHTAAENLDTSNSSERENCELAKDKDLAVNYTNGRPYSWHGGHSTHLQELAESRISQSGLSTDQNGTFKNKQTLGETLYALIENQHPADAEKVTGILLEMDIQTLEHLIKDADLLENKVKDILAVLQNASEPMQGTQSEVVLKQHCDKSVVGEELYELVCEFNTEQADKITGMLLEMDLQDLEVLVKDRIALQQKVIVALKALNNQMKKPVTSSLPEQETSKTALGEKLYYLISKWYPEQADKITGMLLELDFTTLNMLVEDSVALKEKASLAANILSETNTEKEIIPCNSEEKNEISVSGTRHSLAKQLYSLINKWYPLEAEELTTMLTDSKEVDSSTLETLVLNEQLLKEKIERMLDKNQETQTTVSRRESSTGEKGEDITKEELGGQLYGIIEVSHPKNADKITGMLLEMDIADLQNLLKNPQDLEEKIQLAEKALLHM